ncbi:MAG: YkoF family thiamine/hydroxymethylpyrimidine-binding protein [Luteibaculaceae bacterium]
MQVTIEISLYPLKENFIKPIDSFIEALHTYPNVVVKTNVTSTHITGSLDTVFELLKTETKAVFNADFSSVFVFKMISHKHTEES